MIKNAFNMSIINRLLTMRRKKGEKFLPKLGQNLGKNGVFNKKISQDFALRDLLTFCYHIFFFLVGRIGIEPITY